MLNFRTEEKQAKFYSKISKTDTGCWVWTGSKDQCGYGMVRIGSKRYRVHRAVWTDVNGPIPEGLNCLHRCDNPPCCNPEHLWLGTQAENVYDMIKKKRDRQATGDRNGSRLHPQSRPRGDTHYSRMKPECLARGDRNGSRTCPESRPKGSGHWKSIMTEEEVRALRAAYAKGGVSYGGLMQIYGLKKSSVANIVKRRLWKHVA